MKGEVLELEELHRATQTLLAMRDIHRLLHDRNDTATLSDFVQVCPLSSCTLSSSFSPALLPSFFLFLLCPALNPHWLHRFLLFLRLRLLLRRRLLLLLLARCSADAEAWCGRR